MSASAASTRCRPAYYPRPGSGFEDAAQADRMTNGRFHVVFEGRAIGVYPNPNDANAQTDGWSGQYQRAAKTWEGPNSVENLWDRYCDENHQGGCPTPTLPDGFTASTAVWRHGTRRSARVPAAPPVRAHVPAAQAPNPPRTPQRPRTAGPQLGSPFVVPSSVSPEPLPPYVMPRAPLRITPHSPIFPGYPASSAATESSLTSTDNPSPRSPRTPIDIDSDPEAEYVSTDFDFDSLDNGLPNEFGPFCWGIKGMRRRIYDHPLPAIRAAVSANVGPMMVLMSAVDEMTLEGMHELDVDVAVLGSQPVAGPSRRA
ncbi:hypothetical protein R3P38DRAFT_3198596 [Favolaschia claudopus]|uniref:Uncharacterized protein n=1 Tax=Favolaschia claudopus TaxID=2862362 RepID=A0AAW0B2F2_9AGAR